MKDFKSLDPHVLNIVIPMAGRGSRFSNAGYKDPKPLIPVHGVPMIHFVIENIRPTQKHRFLFLVLQEHLDVFDLQGKLLDWAPGARVIPVSQTTEGAACTVLLAKTFINSAHPLLIANCDQFVNANISDFVSESFRSGLDGCILTMDAESPKWSYVAIDSNGHVTRVAEKEVISRSATVGLYFFKRGSDFVTAAETMIQRNRRVNGEFYVAPVYNEMIERGSRIGVHSIGTDRDGMFGLGTPEDLTHFLELPLGREYAGRFRDANS